MQAGNRKIRNINRLVICEIDILDLKDDTIEDRIEALGFNCVEIMNVCAVRNGSSAETIKFLCCKL